MRRFALLLTLIAAPATAAEPMTGAEFDAYTQGRTLTYSAGGSDFGMEQYFKGRRVLWTFLDGDCAEGEWYERGEMICFVYDAYEAHQCWSFFRAGDGIMARFENDPESRPLYQTRISREPLICPGPKVGV